MKLSVALKLGRVSNLPTVWTNAVAGAVIAGVTDCSLILLACLALSFFYVGGMWLNDAFDAKIDSRERNQRPIPRGDATVTTVAIVGVALLLAGIAASFLLGAFSGWAAVGLAATVLLYDWLHKRTAFSPVIMGLARFFCYIVAAGIIGTAAQWSAVIAGAVGLLAYVVGLTYAARQEAYDQIDNAWPLAVLAVPLIGGLWLSVGSVWTLIPWLMLCATVGYALRRLFRRAPGDVPAGVVTLIAGIALYDAVLIMATGHIAYGLAAIAGFGLTLILQRVVPGT